jgi:hypothetical protein
LKISFTLELLLVKLGGRKFRIFKDKLLSRICDPVTDGLRRGWRRVQNEDLNVL